VCVVVVVVVVVIVAQGKSSSWAINPLSPLSRRHRKRLGSQSESQPASGPGPAKEISKEQKKPLQPAPSKIPAAANAANAGSLSLSSTTEKTEKISESVASKKRQTPTGHDPKKIPKVPPSQKYHIKNN
jgi:hypothetical protein